MIIDASVAIKWFLIKEDYWDKAKLLLEQHINGIEQIIVPNLLFLEIINTFATKKNIGLSTGEEILRLLFSISLKKYHPTDEDILETFKLAKKYKTTSYDMLYAVIAKKLKTTLVTADERFVKVTRFSYVRLLSQI